MERYIGNFEVHRFSFAFDAVPSHLISKLKQKLPLLFATAAGEAFQNGRNSTVQSHLRLINPAFHLIQVADSWQRL